MVIREIQRPVRKFKTEDMRSKCGRSKFEHNDYCRKYFIKKSFCHTFPVISKAQDYGKCMETKKAIFRNSKERIPSLVHLSCERELTCLVYEGENL